MIDNSTKNYFKKTVLTSEHQRWRTIDSQAQILSMGLSIVYWWLSIAFNYYQYVLQCH